MAKQETEQEPKKAVPQLVADETKAHADLLPGASKKVEHRPDSYLLTDPAGVDFNASPNMYRRVYSKDASFIVKKSPIPVTKH